MVIKLGWSKFKPVIIIEHLNCVKINRRNVMLIINQHYISNYNNFLISH